MAFTAYKSQYRKLLRLAKSWPKDLVRGKDRDFRQVLLTNLTSSANRTVRIAGSENVDWWEVKIQAMTKLLQNKYKEKYPTSEALLRPKSNPSYYESLTAHLQKQQQQKSGSG